MSKIFTVFELRQAIRGLNQETKVRATDEGIVIVAATKPIPKEYRGNIDIKAVRLLLNAGLKKSEIARKLGISRQNLHEAIKKQKQFEQSNRRK